MLRCVSVCVGVCVSVRAGMGGCLTLVGASEGLAGLQTGVDPPEVSEQRTDLLLPALLLLIGAENINRHQI